jgi:hypothetical protein
MADTPVPTGSAPAAPSASPTPTATPAPATSAPVQSSTPSPTPGPAAATPTPAAANVPPQERWPDILTNARKKAREEAEAEFRQRYGRYDAFEQDPWGAVQQWLSQAQTHSIYGPMVKTWAQQQFAQEQTRGEEPQADVPVRDEQGRETGRVYSDKQLRLWHQWNQQAQQAELEQRLSPLEERAAQFEQRERLMQAHQDATQVLTKLRAMPYFKENEVDIREALESHPEYGDNIYAAYVDVMGSKILPQLGQAEQQKVIDSIQNKQTGATVSPTGVSPARPAFKNFREAAEYYAAHPEEAKAMAERSRG